MFLVFTTDNDVLWGALRYSIGLFHSSGNDADLNNAREVGRSALLEIMRRKDLSNKENSQ